MAEAAHGTAPSLEGKNVANPLAMILAAAALLSQTDDDGAGRRGARSARRRSRRSRRARRRPTSTGHASTTEFTDEVIRRTRTKLEVWSTL